MLVQRENELEEKPLQELRTAMNSMIKIFGEQDTTIIISTHLFHEQDFKDEKIKKFIAMPLGKALEWYARTRQMSRGGIIYATPLFKDLFTQKHLRFPYNSTNNCMIPITTPLMASADGCRIFEQQYSKVFFPFCKISPHNTPCCIFGENYNNVSNPKKKIKGHELEAFLDTIAGQLFLLSKAEIMTLLNISSKQVLLRDDIKMIQKIQKISPLLQKNSPLLQWNPSITVKCLDIVDPASYVKKIDTNNFEQMGPYIIQGLGFAFPFFLKLISSYIQQSSFVKTIIPHRIAHIAIAHSPFLTPLLLFLGDYILSSRQEPDHLKINLTVGGGLSLWSCGISYLPSLILPINSFKRFVLWCVSLPLIWRPTFDLLNFCRKVYKNEHWEEQPISLQELITSPPRCLWRGGRIL